MTRLIILALLGYGAYRAAKRFVSSVPGSFEPILLAPPTTKAASIRARSGGSK